MSERGLKELDKQGLFGHDHISQLEFCERCVFGKATRQKSNLGKHETKQTLDYVHSDIWGLHKFYHMVEQEILLPS